MSEFKRGDKVKITGGLHEGKIGIYLKSNGTNKLIEIDGATKGIRKDYIKLLDSGEKEEEKVQTISKYHLPYDFDSRIYDKYVNLDYIFFIDVENSLGQFNIMRKFFRKNPSLLSNIHVHFSARQSGKEFLSILDRDEWVSINFAKTDIKQSADIAMTSFTSILHVLLPKYITFFFVSGDQFISTLVPEIQESKSQTQGRPAFALNKDTFDFEIFLSKLLIERKKVEEALFVSELRYRIEKAKSNKKTKYDSYENLPETVKDKLHILKRILETLFQSESKQVYVATIGTILPLDKERWLDILLTPGVEEYLSIHVEDEIIMKV